LISDAAWIKLEYPLLPNVLSAQNTMPNRKLLI
jgi:hypothetical protein